MGSGFPVAQGRAMATATERRYVIKLYLVPIPNLKRLKILFVVTVMDEKNAD